MGGLGSGGGGWLERLGSSGSWVRADAFSSFRGSSSYTATGVRHSVDGRSFAGLWWHSRKEASRPHVTWVGTEGYHVTFM